MYLGPSERSLVQLEIVYLQLCLHFGVLHQPSQCGVTRDEAVKLHGIELHHIQYISQVDVLQLGYTYVIVLLADGTVGLDETVVALEQEAVDVDFSRVEGYGRRVHVPYGIVKYYLTGLKLDVGAQLAVLVVRLGEVRNGKYPSAVSDAGIVSPVHQRAQFIVGSSSTCRKCQHGTAFEQDVAVESHFQAVGRILNCKVRRFEALPVVIYFGKIAFHPYPSDAVVDVAFQSSRHGELKRNIQQLFQSACITHPDIKFEIVLRLRQVLFQVEQSRDIALRRPHKADRQRMIGIASHHITLHERRFYAQRVLAVCSFAGYDVQAVQKVTACRVGCYKRKVLQ